MDTTDRDAVMGLFASEEDGSVAALIAYDAKNVSKRITSVDNVMTRA